MINVYFLNQFDSLFRISVYVMKSRFEKERSSRVEGFNHFTIDELGQLGNFRQLYPLRLTNRARIKCAPLHVTLLRTYRYRINLSSSLHCSRHSRIWRDPVSIQSETYFHDGQVGKIVSELVSRDIQQSFHVVILYNLWRIFEESFRINITSQNLFPL